VGFVPVTRSYRADPTFFKNGAPIVEIPLADICPVHRSVGIFRDSEDGVPARERVVKILRGFRLAELIPPVEVGEVQIWLRLWIQAHRIEPTVFIAQWSLRSPDLTGRGLAISAFRIAAT
jgi:hypothetical protein